jgi:hypothetical protein
VGGRNRSVVTDRGKEVGVIVLLLSLIYLNICERSFLSFFPKNIVLLFRLEI